MIVFGFLIVGVAIVAIAELAASKSGATAAGSPGSTAAPPTGTTTTAGTPPYDATATGTTTSSSAAGVADTTQGIMSYLMSQGLSRVAAAGVVGNLQQESSLNPSTPGGGLAQWQAPRGPSSWDFASQLEYLANDLRTTYSGLLSELNAARSPAAAAILFQNQYERPSIPMQSNRINYANQAYQAGG